MKTNDYVKYMTEQFVKYFDTPKQERRERKEVRKEKKVPASQHWFGILPYSFKLWMQPEKIKRITRKVLLYQEGLIGIPQ
ncbi:YqzE family protein [Bacillus velezensis]